MTGFELQGHRGARGLFPENTIEGFVAALDIGLDSIELDIAVTADGVAVVVHDPVLNGDLVRTADGQWLSRRDVAIRDLDFATVLGFDVGRIRPGSALAEAHPEQVPFDGARIPSLAEVFAATAHAGVRIDAELKTDPAKPELSVSPEVMADAVVRVARDAGALDRLAVRSFDWRGLAHMRTHYPDVPLAWLTGPTRDAETPSRVAEAALRCGFVPTWAPFHATLDEAAVDGAHKLGLRVVPWTVNAVADMRRLIAWGVDGLCTDRPDLAAPLRPL